MTFSETVGWIGMIIVLAAYLLALCRKDYSEGAPYFLLNLLGAILIGIDVGKNREKLNEMQNVGSICSGRGNRTVWALARSTDVGVPCNDYPRLPCRPLHQLQI